MTGEGKTCLSERRARAYSNSNALPWWRCVVSLRIRHCDSTGVVRGKLTASVRVGIIRRERAAGQISCALMWVRMWGRIISPGDHGIIIHVCLTPSEKVLLDDEERGWWTPGTQGLGNSGCLFVERVRQRSQVNR